MALIFHNIIAAASFLTEIAMPLKRLLTADGSGASRFKACGSGESSTIY